MAKLQDIVPEIVNPCEGEQKVKQYHCTHMKSRLLAFRAEGVLQVTSKRAIFRASGHSITGNSVIQSEVPLEDISGISFYKGTFFSFKYLLLAILASLLVIVVFSVLAGVLIAEGSDPKSFMWICVIGGIIGIFAVPRKYVWNSALGGLSTFFLFFIGESPFIMSMLGYPTYSSNDMGLVNIVAFIMFIYTLVAFIIYARRFTMSLSIGSKGGSSTPIYVSGLTRFGYANTAAPRAIEAEPTVESEILIRELGALIMDIQKLGDYGIEKWTKK
jgi:hypothetical protein